MACLLVLFFCSIQFYWLLFENLKEVKSVSFFQEYSVLLMGREFLMIPKREKGRVCCLLPYFLVP